MCLQIINSTVRSQTWSRPTPCTSSCTEHLDWFHRVLLRLVDICTWASSRDAVGYVGPGQGHTGLVEDEASDEDIWWNFGVLYINEKFRVQIEKNLKNTV